MPNCTAFPFRTHLHVSRPRILRWTNLFCINESLTLDRPRKLDSNRCDSEADWSVFRTGCSKNFQGGQRHGARTRGERVRPIRFDQGIGAIDRETGLSSTVDRGARASPRRAHPDHRLPDHHLPWRVRAGGRSEPAKARDRSSAISRRSPICSPSGSTASPQSGRIARQHSSACNCCCPALFRPGASPPAVTSSSSAPTSAFSPACRSMPRLGDTGRILDVVSAALPLTAPGQQRRRHRNHAAERQQRAGDSAASSNRCPARSSSSRNEIDRCGGRTRRCRSRCRPPPALSC